MTDKQRNYSYYFFHRKNNDGKGIVVLRARSKYFTGRFEVSTGQSIHEKDFDPNPKRMPKEWRATLNAFETIFESYGAKEMRPLKEMSQKIKEVLHPQLAEIDQYNKNRYLEAQKKPLNLIVDDAIKNPFDLGTL
jgi:hypothetical protein